MSKSKEWEETEARLTARGYRPTCADLELMISGKHKFTGDVEEFYLRLLDLSEKYITAEILYAALSEDMRG
jgi:hypothetical protein